MRIEIPEFKRCYCCLPLRPGLLFWVYLKLALAIFLLKFFICILLLRTQWNMPITSHIMLGVVLIVLTMDIAFSILFVISAHRKNHEHMRIYYRYAIGILILCVIGLLMFTGIEVYYSTFFFKHHSPYLTYKIVRFICLQFVHIVLQAYLIILVRSEVLKLERNVKFRFENHTEDPECTAQITV